MPAVAIDRVQFRYGRPGPRQRNAPLVLNNISFSVAAGDILCLLGPSGCGKMTLVNLIMGVDVPISGTVRVLEEAAPFPTARARIAMIREGRLIADASPADILARTGTNTLEDAFLALEALGIPEPTEEPRTPQLRNRKEVRHA